MDKKKPAPKQTRSSKNVSMRSLFLAWTSEAADLQQAGGEIDGEYLPQVVGCLQFVEAEKKHMTQNLLY